MTPLIFISARSDDYQYAEQVYSFLKSHGLDVFFSQESLPELASSDYRKEIDDALDNAQHMLVVTSSRANVTSSWVEAEWGLFINEKRSGRKAGNLLTVVAGGLKPSDLPAALRYYEVIALEPDAFPKILRYVTAQLKRSVSPARMGEVASKKQEPPPPNAGANQRPAGHLTSDHSEEDLRSGESFGHQPPHPIRAPAEMLHGQIANADATLTARGTARGRSQDHKDSRRSARKIWLILGVLVMFVATVILTLWGLRLSKRGDVASRSPSKSGRVVEEIGLEMVSIPGDTFTMGSPDNEPNRLQHEGPQHKVTVSSFYMGKYEVTQGQWRAVATNLPKSKVDINPDPSYFKGDDSLPVERVSWEEAIEFCDRVSAVTGKNYRLPTEAEWEYACRAGTIGPYAGNLDSMAWHSGNSQDERNPLGTTHRVGTKQANGFGLHDMYGNVWEWCMDWYSEKYYSQSPSTNPTGPGAGIYHVTRGGGWNGQERHLRSASRGHDLPGEQNNYLGFRLVLTLPGLVEELNREMVEIPGGTFTMGSPDSESGRNPVEGPQHLVTVSSFFMAKYEVTQGQWRAVATNLPKSKVDINPDPSYFKGDDSLPVERVSWEEAIEFCDRVSAVTGKNYRLPTEAEWEYACRARTTGPIAGRVESIAWYDNNSEGKTHPVGTKQANSFGLYDMHGNVWEWCMDWYLKDYYSHSPNTNPQGPSTGWYRVRRGGSWYYSAANLRSACRNYFQPDDRHNTLGFRVVMAPV